MHLQFVESELTFEFGGPEGKSVAFYSNKHGVFRANHSG